MEQPRNTATDNASIDVLIVAPEAATTVAEDVRAQTTELGAARVALSPADLSHCIQQRAPQVILLIGVGAAPGEAEFFRDLAKTSCPTACPVILVADGDDCDESLASDLRVVDFIETPLRRPELIRRIQRAVATNAAARPATENGDEHTPSDETPTERLRLVLQDERAERALLTDMLENAATRDALTGLPNRRALMEHLRKQLCEDPTRAAVLFLDLDNFKVINDSLGHDFGDALLLEFATRVHACVRSRPGVSEDSNDIVARLGGDEFVVLLSALRDRADAHVVAERIIERTSSPFRIRGRVLTVNTSIGLAYCDAPTGDAAEILRNSDLAMYRAKQGGKSRIAVFNASMHSEMSRRLALETALREAIDHEALEVRYQPIVNLSTAQLGSVEALLRWQHPEYGSIAPSEFIPIAEETGLIVPLGRWLMRTTCEQWVAWQRALGGSLPLSLNVNVSKRQVVYPEFAQELREIICQTHIDPHRLNLEITESTVLDVGDVVTEKLNELKQTGVQLHMDDFGTGHSSLSCLHRLPVDCVKIDREFVCAMNANRSCTAVVYAVIALARNLGLRVTAEGVETHEQLIQMLGMDCDYAQGFHFARALQADAIQQLLRTPRPWMLADVTLAANEHRTLLGAL